MYQTTLILGVIVGMALANPMGSLQSLTRRQSCDAECSYEGGQTLCAWTTGQTIPSCCTGSPSVRKLIFRPYWFL